MHSQVKVRARKIVPSDRAREHGLEDDPTRAADNVTERMAIVWIDETPLRNRHLSDCLIVLAQLQCVRERWHHFEWKDKPAFVRWRAREFGVVLSEARDIERQIQEARDLIHEVELELGRHFQTPQSAYARVMFRRGHPGRTEPTTEVENGESRRLTEFEQEALFQEWVRKFIGTNPDKMDDHAYDASFAVFKSHMFSQPSPPPPPAPRRRTEAVGSPATKEEADPEVDERVKALYRKLARQLHPDSRADGSATVSGLWHEVQEAYAASDVARMELLLALSHLQADNLRHETRVGELINLEQELARSLHALSASLQEAERENAWDFARCGPSETLAAEVERHLKFDLANRTRYLDQLEKTLAGWRS